MIPGHFVTELRLCTIPAIYGAGDPEIRSRRLRSKWPPMIPGHFENTPRKLYRPGQCRGHGAATRRMYNESRHDVLRGCTGGHRTDFSKTRSRTKTRSQQKSIKTVQIGRHRGSDGHVQSTRGLGSRAATVDGTTRPVSTT